MKTLRLDHVTVVTPDAAAAARTFRDYFGLATAPGALVTAAGAGTALAIGSARIELVTPAEGTPLAAALAAGGEGMAALTLEVADLGQALAKLQEAGVRFEVEGTGSGRAVRVDPTAAHGVRLTLVGRR